MFKYGNMQELCVQWQHTNYRPSCSTTTWSLFTTQAVSLTISFVLYHSHENQKQRLLVSMIVASAAYGHMSSFSFQQTRALFYSLDYPLIH